MMKIKTLVEDMLNSRESAYSLSKRSGVSAQLIGMYRSNNAKIDNMRIDVAQKLIDANKKGAIDEPKYKVYSSLLTTPILQKFGYDAHFVQVAKGSIKTKWSKWLDYYQAKRDCKGNIYIAMLFEDVNSNIVYEELD